MCNLATSAKQQDLCLSQSSVARAVVYCHIFLYFFSCKLYTRPSLGMNSLPQLCLWSGYTVSLSCHSSTSTSHPHNIDLPVLSSPKPPWSWTQRHKHELATPWVEPVWFSPSGGKEEFKKQDKSSFIATYLKELITYGRWCGIFSVGCLWTNSVVLCKLLISPSLCISFRMVAVQWHVLRDLDTVYLQQKGSGFKWVQFCFYWHI